MQKPSLKIAAKALISSAFISSALLLSSGLMAQGMPDVQKKLDAIIAKAKEKDRFVGLSILVIDKDKGSFKKHYGFRDHARTLAPDDDTMYEIGSITKVFARLALAAQDKIKPDDLLADHLPEGIRVPKPKGQDITIKELMTHTGGIVVSAPCTVRIKDPKKRICFGYDITPGAMNPWATGTRELTFQFLNEFSYSLDEFPEINATPGSFYLYSNVSLGLLGEVIGHRHGSSFEKVLSEKILQPLGMKRTKIAMPCLADKSCQNFAEPHQIIADGSGWQPRPPIKLPGLPAAGALKSSLADMELFLRANLNPEATKISSALTKGQSYLADIKATHDANPCAEGQDRFKDLCNPKKRFFPYAWDAGVGEKFLQHGGVTRGSHAYMGFSRDGKLGAVALSNSSYFGIEEKKRIHVSFLALNCALQLILLKDNPNPPSCKQLVGE